MIQIIALVACIATVICAIYAIKTFYKVDEVKKNLDMDIDMENCSKLETYFQANGNKWKNMGYNPKYEDDVISLYKGEITDSNKPCIYLRYKPKCSYQEEINTVLQEAERSILIWRVGTDDMGTDILFSPHATFERATKDFEERL